MRSHMPEEGGFMLVELLVATVVLSVAILALMATYDAAFVSLHKSARSTAAGTIAQNQLELFSSLPYASIGLDSTSLTAAGSNATYSADEAALTVPTGATVANV